MDFKLNHFMLLFLASSFVVDEVNGNMVFPVHHKFKGQKRSWSALRAHDVRRHNRLLFGVDLELGGNSLPTEAGLYYAKIGIGTPSKEYHVHVDTGSDILWLNCEGCKGCPKSSDLNIKLSLYDPKSSSTSSTVKCDQPFCTSLTDNYPHPDCSPGKLCPYKAVYGDGSSTSGYYVKDSVQLNRVTGNLKTAPANGGSVIFGCGAEQTGLNNSSAALDGILGFGQANSSMLSQLASAGKVKKMFAHCLDNINGGGLVAIGEVVKPIVNTTPVIPNKAHYNIMLKKIEVGGDVLPFPKPIFDRITNGTIIDSGATFSYLPSLVYDRIVPKIMDSQPALKVHTVQQQFTCFHYKENIDDGFPTVTFHFEGNLSLTVYPHEYLFTIDDNEWCVGWQTMEQQSMDSGQMTVLGDMAFSNKLVVYDLEKQTIGWSKFDCTSTIQVKDESGAVYSVKGNSDGSAGGPLGTRKDSTDSPASTLIIGKTFTICLLLVAMLHNFVF